MANPDIDQKIFNQNIQAVAAQFGIDPNKPIPAHLVGAVSAAIAAQPSASVSYNAMQEQQVVNAKAIEAVNAAQAEKKKLEEEGGGGGVGVIATSAPPSSDTSAPTTPAPLQELSWWQKKSTPLGPNWVLVLFVTILVLGCSCSFMMVLMMT
jgi:hypothetical protein